MKEGEEDESRSSKLEYNYGMDRTAADLQTIIRCLPILLIIAPNVEIQNRCVFPCYEHMKDMLLTPPSMYAPIDIAFSLSINHTAPLSHSSPCPLHTSHPLPCTPLSPSFPPLHTSLTLPPSLVPCVSPSLSSSPHHSLPPTLPPPPPLLPLPLLPLPPSISSSSSSFFLRIYLPLCPLRSCSNIQRS